MFTERTKHAEYNPLCWSLPHHTTFKSLLLQQRTPLFEGEDGEDLIAIKYPASNSVDSSFQAFVQYDVYHVLLLQQSMLSFLLHPSSGRTCALAFWCSLSLLKYRYGITLWVLS